MGFLFLSQRDLGRGGGKHTHTVGMTAAFPFSPSRNCVCRGAREYRGCLPRLLLLLQLSQQTHERLSSTADESSAKWHSSTMATGGREYVRAVPGGRSLAPHSLARRLFARAPSLSLSSWAAARSLARSLPHWLSREYRTRRRQWEIGRRFTRALDRKRAIERLRLTHTHTRSPVREFGRMRRNQEAPLAERRRKFHWLSLFIDWFFFFVSSARL